MILHDPSTSTARGLSSANGGLGSADIWYRMRDATLDVDYRSASKRWEAEMAASR